MPSETCPKCGKPRLPGATDCPSCGVVFGRFRNIVKPAPLKTGTATRARQAPLPALPGSPAPAAPGATPPAPVSGRQAENLLRLVAHALESGLTLSAFARSGGLHALPAATARRLTADADAGVPLSQSLRELGFVDGPSAGLLRAKETHGGQPAALVAIADRIADRRKARNRLLTVVVYPYLLLLALAVISPAPVAFTRGLAAYLSAAFPGVAALVGLPVFLFGVLPRLDPAGRLSSKAQRLLARVPLLGAGARADALASFVDVLGASIASGVSVREALPLAAEAGSGAPGFSEAGPRAVARLDAGASLAAALAELPGLPPVVVSQIAAGEATGRLDEVLLASRKELESRARAGWIGLAIAVGAVLAVGALGAVTLSIIAGFGDAMSQMARGIDAVAPGP